MVLKEARLLKSQEAFNVLMREIIANRNYRPIFVSYTFPIYRIRENIIQFQGVNFSFQEIVILLKEHFRGLESETKAFRIISENYDAAKKVLTLTVERPLLPII